MLGASGYQETDGDFEELWNGVTVSWIRQLFKDVKINRWVTLESSALTTDITVSNSFEGWGTAIDETDVATAFVVAGEFVFPIPISLALAGGYNENLTNQLVEEYRAGDGVILLAAVSGNVGELGGLSKTHWAQRLDLSAAYGQVPSLDEAFSNIGIGTFEISAEYETKSGRWTNYVFQTDEDFSSFSLSFGLDISDFSLKRLFKIGD